MEDVIVKCHDPEAERLCTGAGDLRPVDPEVTSVAIQGLRSHTLYRAKVAVSNSVGWSKVSCSTRGHREPLAASARHAGHQLQQHSRLVETQSGYNVSVSEDDVAWSSISTALALGWCQRGRTQNPWPRFQWPYCPGSASRCGLHSEDGCPERRGPSGVTLAETNDTRRRDVAPKVERPSTFQSSLYRSCLERGSCDLCATTYSGGIVATCGRASRRLRRS